jgi:hypothetical protein
MDCSPAMAAGPALNPMAQTQDANARIIRNKSAWVWPQAPQLTEPMREEIKTKSSSQKSLETVAPNSAERSLREALQDRARRQALRAEGIVLHTDDVDEQGQLKERKLTPLLEKAANQARTHLAGLSDADMSMLDQAVFMAAISASS